MNIVQWFVVIKVNRGIEYDDVGIWIQATDSYGNVFNHAEVHYQVGLSAYRYDVIVVQADFYTTFADYAKIVEGFANGERLWRDSFTGHLPPFNGQTLDEWGVAIHEQVHFAEPPPTPPPEVVPPPVSPPPPFRPPKPEPPITEPPDKPEPPPPCGDLDAETFREFWTLWGAGVDKLGFEVPLDDGVDVPDLPEPWRSVWKHLTHHRIDVVFSRKGVLYVAEIKPRLSLAAIGTAIVARTMVMQRYDISAFSAVKAAVISQYGSPTLIQAAATHRVVIFLTKGIDGLYEPVALHDVIF